MTPVDAAYLNSLDLPLLSPEQHTRIWQTPQGHDRLDALSAEACLRLFAWQDFRDPEGYPLQSCADFIRLVGKAYGLNALPST